MDWFLLLMEVGGGGVICLVHDERKALPHTVGEMLPMQRLRPLCCAK